MHKIIDEQGKRFELYSYAKEEELERIVVKQADAVFGPRGIYFDVKRRLGKPKKGAAVPDGYYLDLMFHEEPKLYFVEVELGSHDVYGHIGEQILRFSLCSETDRHRIKTVLLDEIEKDAVKRAKINDYLRNSSFGNVNALLDRVVFDARASAFIVIDEATPELDGVLAQLRMETEVIEVQTYGFGEERLHRIASPREEMLADSKAIADADALDTLVVPAREDGFQEQFIHNRRWFAVRIASSMLDKIRYIAAYRVSPISAVTHVAEVERIDKYGDTNKYILYLKEGSVRPLKPVRLSSGKGFAPQAPRYTSLARLERAETLAALWDSNANG